MEEKQSSNQGYRKINKENIPAVTIKKNVNVDYASPLAKKWPDLIAAIESGNADAVKKFIEEGINVSMVRGGVTPLMVAAAKGQTEIAKIIIGAGVNINEKNEEGWTALHKAAHDQAGTAIIDLLMESGIYIDGKDNRGKTALALAEEKKHNDIVRVINKFQQQLANDAKAWQEFLNTAEGKPYRLSGRIDTLTAYSKMWWLPPLALGLIGLFVGIFFGMIQSLIIGTVTGLFLDGGIYIRVILIRKYLDQFEPLAELDIHLLRQKRKAGERITVRRKKVILPPMEHTPDVSQNASALSEVTKSVDTAAGESTFTQSLKNSSYVELRKAVVASIIIIFLAVVVLAAVNRVSLLHWYFTKQLERRNVTFAGSDFLEAVSKNDMETVDLFIKAGIACDVKNEKGQTGLFIAAEKGYGNVFKRLVKLNPSLINQADGNGMTPLMAASNHGQEAIVHTLVENGASVNFVVEGRAGCATALQALLDVPEFKKEYINILQYLLEKGADVKGKNAAGRFPLLFAADHGNVEAAKLLFGKKELEVNDVDLSGETALLVAACRGYTEFVALLADRGANIKTSSTNGETPLLCAVREGHPATVTVLLAKGADINDRTAKGTTALTEAAEKGNVEMVKMLLEKGAKPSPDYFPDSLRDLKGKTVVVNKTGTDVVKRIAAFASQDGYTIIYNAKMRQGPSLKVKGRWENVLREFANKNHLYCVIKEKEIYLLPYNPNR
jgi:ankyrin repeat protein